MSLSREVFQHHAELGVYCCPACSISRDTHPELMANILRIPGWHLGRHSAKLGRSLVQLSDGCTHAQWLIDNTEPPFSSIEQAQTAWADFCRNWLDWQESAAQNERDTTKAV